MLLRAYRMALFALLTAASVSYGQTISDVQVEDLSHGCLKVKYSWVAPGSGYTVALSAGNTVSADEYGTRSHTVAIASGTSWLTKCGLSAETKVYYKLSVGSTVATCPVVCTDCDSGDDSLFAAAPANESNCDDEGEPPNVTTPAAGDGDPSPPVHAVSNPYGLCDSPDATYEATPANYTTVWATAAAAATDGQVVMVKMEPGLYQAETFELPATAHANGLVCMYPDVDAALLPTPKARVAFENVPNMYVLEGTNVYKRERTNATTGTLQHTKAASNWVIRGAWFRDPLKPYAPFQAEVASVDTSTPSVTLTSGSCPSGLAASHVLTLNLPGLSAYPGHSAVLSCTSGTITLTGTFTGTYTSGGTITWGSYIPIESCTTGTPVQCDTSVDHGLPTGNYTGQDWVYVGLVKGQTAVNGNQHFTVVDANTIEFDDTASAGTYEASDYDFLRYNGGMAQTLVYALNLDRFWILQSIIGNPNVGAYSRRTSVVLARTSGSGSAGIRDSIFFSGGPNCPADPDSDVPNCSNYAAFANQAVNLAAAGDRQIINNTFIDPNGINLDAQNSSSGGVSDVSVLRNHFYRSERTMIDRADGNFPGSLDLYNLSRHSAAEFKSCGDRISVRGNYISGNTAEQDQPQGYTLLFATSPNAQSTSLEFHCRDVDIQWNWFNRVPASIAVNGAQQGADRYNVGIAQRVRIANNVLNQNHLRYRTAPGHTNNADKAGAGYNGQFLNIGTGGEDLKVLNNIMWNSIATAPAMIRFGGGSGDAWANCTNEANIYTFHRGLAGATQTSGVAWLSGQYSVTNTSFATVWAGFCRGTSTFDNLIIPGLEQAGVTDFETRKAETNTTYLITDEEADTAWSGLEDNLVDGADFITRFDAVFPTGKPIPAESYSAFGMDYETLLDEMGMTRNLTVTQVGGSLVFAWRAPTTQACAVRLSDDDFTTATVETADSGSNQTVTFTGVSGSLRALVECPDGISLSWAGELE
jgi:hypothetical protein